MSQPAPDIHTETLAETLAAPTSKKGMVKAVAKVSQPAPDIRTENPAEPMAESMTEQMHKDREAQAVAAMFEPGSNIEIPAERTFTCFPRLPAELRMKVWKYASHVTRNIDISTRILYLSSEPQGKGAAPSYYYTSSCPPPSILHVCKESRTEAMIYYQLDFESSENVWNRSGTSRFPPVYIATPPSIYINWQVDRVCLMDPDRFEDYNEESDACTRRLEDFVALCVKNKLEYFAANLTLEAPYTIWFVPWEANLKELIIFHDDHCSARKTFRGIDFVDVTEEEYYTVWKDLKTRALYAASYYDGCKVPERLRCCNLKLDD